jgi:hypothetical protein
MEATTASPLAVESRAAQLLEDAEPCYVACLGVATLLVRAHDSISQVLIGACFGRLASGVTNNLQHSMVDYYKRQS